MWFLAVVGGQGAPPQPKYFRAQDYPNDSGGKILLTWGPSPADNLSDFKIDEQFNTEFAKALPTLRNEASEALKGASGPAADYIFTRLLTLARRNFRETLARKLQQKEKRPKLTYIIEYSADPNEPTRKLAEVASNANLQGTNKVLFGNYPGDPYGHFLVVDLAEQIYRDKKEAYEKGVAAIATREQMALERFEQRADKRKQVLKSIADELAFAVSLQQFGRMIESQESGESDLKWLCRELLKVAGVSGNPFDVRIEGGGAPIRLLRAAWNTIQAQVISGSYFRNHWYPLTEKTKTLLLQIRQKITMRRDLARSNHESLKKRWNDLTARIEALQKLKSDALKHPALKEALETLKKEIEKEKNELGSEAAVNERIEQEKKKEKEAEADLARFEGVVSELLSRYKQFVCELKEKAQAILGRQAPPNAGTIFQTTLKEWESFLNRLAAYSACCHLADNQIQKRLEPWFAEAKMQIPVSFNLPAGAESAYRTTLKALLNEIKALEGLKNTGIMTPLRNTLLQEAKTVHGPFGPWARQGNKVVKGVEGSLYLMEKALKKIAQTELDKAAVFEQARKALSTLWDAYRDALIAVKEKRKAEFEEALRKPLTFYLSMRQGEGESAKVYRVGQAEVAASPDFFHTGKITTLILAALACGLVYLFIRLARGGKELFIRKIPGLDAVDEAVGRATEMGRPVYFITGLGSMDALPVIAAINILGRIARKTAEHDTRLRMPCYDPIVMSVAQEVVKEAATAVGRPDTFRKDDIFFVAQEQFAYAAAVDGMFVREKPATIFYMGMFYAESLLLAETGAAVGAIQIAGTDSYSQLPFFITACDYTLIGEELYAASAYLSREPVLLGSLRGQDTMKGLIMVAILVGFVLALFGVDIVRLLFVEG